MPESAGPADGEAEHVLTGLARGRFGRISPQIIARHVMRSQVGADWAVRKAAFDALVRRYTFAQRDRLHVTERPERGVWGSYRTSNQAKGSEGQTRPYETALYGLDPLVTSCACADFVRSSLGLCKHGLTVLELLETRGALAAAPSGEVAARPALRWSYAQPLEGPYDRLLRLELDTAKGAAAISGMRDGRLDPRVLGDLAERARLLDELESAAVSAEPAVSTLISEERARVQKQRGLLPHAAAALASVSELKRELYPYQREGLERFLSVGRLLLADDMGLGKTTQAVAACHGLLRVGAVERVLLIVPTPLKAQWQREWEGTSVEPLQLVEGSPKERKRLYRATRRGALVIGYEQLLRDLEHVKAYAPELVVLDEAQRIKNWATKSAAYVKSLAPVYRLVLTGTPMENRFDELASIMDFVDDLALEPKWRLVPYHTLPRVNDQGPGGARHLGSLRARLSQTMLRRSRQDVLSQLPARTDTRVPVEMTEVQRTRHDELKQPIAELVARIQQRTMASGEFVRLMQLLTLQRMICNGMAQVQFDQEWARCQNTTATPALLETLFSPKLSVLRGLIEQVVIEQRRKVVVFSQWRKLLCLSEWAVRDVLAEHGLRALFFTGAESVAARERAIAEFHEDPSASVLFASDAGATGLNLQRAASCCINMELPWNPALLAQRIARIHRLGQTQPIDVYNLVAEDGIEGRIAQLLERKQAIFSSLFDGTSDEVVLDGSGGNPILDSVAQLVDGLPLAAASESSSDLEPSVDLEASAAVSEALPEPPDAAPAIQPALTALEQVGLRITTMVDGGLRIEAPPGLAAELTELLSAFAQRKHSN